MIFKFDKGGNMKNIGMEGDIQDMARKKDRFSTVNPVVNEVKKEEGLVMAEVLETQTQVAVGFESLNDDEDMVQQHEVELVKEMESENDKIWDKGSRDGVGDESENDGENKEMPTFGSLSEKMKIESGEDKEQIPKYQFNQEFDEKQKKKDELAKKREANKLKKELKQMDLKLKESKNWSFSHVIPCSRQGEIKKYITVISAYDLASWFENSIIKFIPSIQRGSKFSPSGQEKDNFSPKHVMEIFNAFTKNRIHGNTIVLNYSLDNESELVYTPEENSISGEGYLQGVDFSHRARAAIKWKSAWIKNPDQYEDPREYQFNCEVNNLSDDEAREMFAEYNNYSLKVNPTRISYLGNTNFSNKITRKIESDSDWKGKIETVSTTIKSSSVNICTFGVLNSAIRKNYAPQTKLEQNDIENWLIEYIDQLVSIFPQFMANPNLEVRNNLKKLYFTIEPLAIGAMIALSTVLKDDPDWKSKLAKLAKDDFFLRTASRWRPTLKEDGKIINGTASVKHFNETVINWCTK